MAIVFFCQSCGSRFEVDPSLAGRRGRCKQCGHPVTIPRAEELSSAAGPHAAARSAFASLSGASGPTLAVVSSVEGQARASAGTSTGAHEGRGQRGRGPSISSWLHSKDPDATLVPLSSEPAGRPIKPSPLDDAEDDRPYALAGAEPRPRGPVRSRDRPTLRAWRRTIGRARRPFRFVNESAYLVSTPFLMLLLVGGALRSRPMVVLGASVVVLLNLLRIAAGSVDLVLVPMRDGANLEKLKKPLRRVAGPALTIGLVVLAFAFIPWLSNGEAQARAGPRRRIRHGARSVRRDVQNEIGAAVHAAEPTLGNGERGARAGNLPKPPPAGRPRRDPPRQ